MKTDKVLTVGQLKRWCDDNNISDDTPIAIYNGDYEDRALAYGVIGETKDIVNNELEPESTTETTGEHCYMRNIDIFEESGEKQLVIITDGIHCE